MTSPRISVTSVTGKTDAAVVSDPLRRDVRVGALENRLPPPLLVLVTGGLMALVMLGGADPLLPAAWRWGLAGAAFAAAGLFGYPAIAAFVRAGTTINPVQIDRASALVTSGVYRITRNPMYVALALLLCAWAAWLGQPLAVIGPIGFVLFIDRFQIVPEERILAARFGAAYDAYRQRVRRWL